MRALSLLALLTLSASAQVRPALTPAQYREDFAVFCAEVQSTYAYFDTKTTRWDSVAALYEPDLARVRTHGELIDLLERAIAELYDDHAHLNVNTQTSPKLVPSGADLWAEWVGGAATVVGVREGSEAERAGIQAGTKILSVNGTPVASAVEQNIGRAVVKTDPAVRNWALRRALAGRHGETRRIDGFVLSPQTADNADRPPLAFERLDGNIGYIRFHDSLGDNATVAELDRALAALRDTRGLVLDLRDTPGGGNSNVARGILGRFVSREMPYQKHVRPAEERETGIRRTWIELVSPRGPFSYPKKVAVLVGRWTGSMGEGLAIGFDAIGGTTVGGPMAQLLGATYQFSLPNSGIGVSIPAERLYHVDGTPREAFRPKIPATDDAALKTAIRAVRR